MDNYQIRPAQRENFPHIAQLIAQQNRMAQFRCLHSDEGSAAGVLHTMNQHADEESLAFVYATDPDRKTIRAFGSEYDQVARRLWLWGPFAWDGDRNPEQWLALTAQLYDALLVNLPFTPRLMDGFIDQPFSLGARLYEKKGHHLAKTVYVFLAPRPGELILPDVLCPRLTSELAASFATLFDEIFPDTYYTGEEIVRRINDKEQVFVYSEDGVVLGFCHANVNEGAQEGYIEFIGVHDTARRRGIAKRLLQTAMHWLFAERDMSNIGLTTGDDNVNAQALYRQVGFELTYTGLAYRHRFEDT